jgi:hypothetical protein
MKLTSVYRKLRKVIKGRSLSPQIEIRKSDVFVVSYPKSGNTWMRFLLINYIYNKDRNRIEYSDLESYIPSIHRSSVEEINAFKEPRIIKSHLINEEYPKVIYIVRDGRDALVSYYHYLVELRGYDWNFAEFMKSHHVSGKNSWEYHLRQALDFKEKFQDNIFFVKYEELKSNTHISFRKVLQFLKLYVDDSQLDFAIASSSFKNLQNMQQESGVNIEDKEINFFRKGSSGQWQDYFDKKMNSEFLSTSKDLFDRFNYEGID